MHNLEKREPTGLAVDIIGAAIILRVNLLTTV
jgi:hypothetical protein